MGLNQENIFAVQSWEFLKPDYLFQTIGNSSGTFAQFEKLGLAQVSATSSQTITGEYANLNSMSISVSCNQGQSLMILFSCSVFGEGNGYIADAKVQITKDGVAISGTERRCSIWMYVGGGVYSPLNGTLSINYIDENVAAGIHTYKIQAGTDGCGASLTNRTFTIIRIKPIDE
jgi:hypothetical protein